LSRSPSTIPFRAALGAALLLLAGCASAPRFPAASYERGVSLHERGRHRDAVATFEQFLRRSPTDSLAAAALHYKALSLMAIKDYAVAAVELQILRQEHPGSDFARESWYLEGVAHLKQVGRIERDVTQAEAARACFRRFLAESPDAPEAAQARQSLVAISDLMLRKTLGEAEVYDQLDRPAAGALVLGQVLAEEQEGTLRPRALLRRAQLAAKAGDEVAAQACWRELVERHPDTSEAAVARRRLGTAGGAP